jgi:hypothetical protein
LSSKLRAPSVWPRAFSSASNFAIGPSFAQRFDEAEPTSSPWPAMGQYVVVHGWRLASIVTFSGCAGVGFGVGPGGGGCGEVPSRRENSVFAATVNFEPCVWRIVASSAFSPASMVLPSRAAVNIARTSSRVMRLLRSAEFSELRMPSMLIVCSREGSSATLPTLSPSPVESFA